MTGPTFVLGLDGLSKSMLEALIERRILRAADLLCAEAPPRQLLSTVPSFTIPGWASAFTGVPPGAHGLLWWLRGGPDLPWRHREASGFVNLDTAATPTLWNVVSAADGRVAVVDVPATFPAPRVNGVAISGFLAPWPNARAVFPAHLGDQVLRWRAPEGTAEKNQAADLVSTTVAMTAAARQRLAFTRSAIDDGHDLVVHVMIGPDRLSHRSWSRAIPDPGADDATSLSILAYWRVVDEAFALALHVLERGGSVIICSDHGSQAPRNRRYFTRRWLAERGYIRRTVGGHLLPSGVAPLVRPLRRPARAMGSWIRTRRPTGSFGLATHAASVIDVSLGDREVGYFIDPSTEGSAREQLRRSLIEGLRAIAENDEPVFDRVDTADAFMGPAIESSVVPDVMAVSTNRFCLTPGSALSPKRSIAHKSDRGIHSREGVLVIAGATVDHGPIANIEDVAPTALDMVGVATPASTRGVSRVLGRETRRPVVAAKLATPDLGAMSEDDSQGIEAHLRGLGYLE